MADPVPAGTTEQHGPPADLGRWTRALARLGAAVNAGRPLGELLEQAARTACDLLGYESSAVLLVDESRSVLRIEGSWGLSARYVAEVNEHRPLRIEPGDGSAASPSRRAFVEQHAVLVDDIDAHRDYGPWTAAARAAGHRSMAAVPLRRGTDVVGTFNVYGTRPRQLSPAGADLLALLADHVGTALESQALLERDRARLAELDRLNGELEVERRRLLALTDLLEQVVAVAREGGGITSTTARLARVVAAPLTVTDGAGTVLCTVAHDGLAVEPPDQRLLAVPVQVGDEVLGTLWTSPPRDALHRRGTEQAAVVLGQALLLRRAREDAAWRLRGDLLGDLLRSGGPPSSDLVDRGRRAGTDLLAPHVLVVLRAAAGPRDLLRRTRSRSGHLPSGLLTTGWEGDVVLAVPAPLGSVEGVVSRLRADLAADLGTPVRAAVAAQGSSSSMGATVRRLDGLLRLVPQRADEPLLTLRDAGLAGFLLSVGGAEEGPGPLVERWLGPAIAHDAEHGTALVATLRAWTDHARSTTATARALSVHPNTVLLRLRRAAALLAVDLDDVDHLTAVRASLLLHQLAAPPPPGPGA